MDEESRGDVLSPRDKVVGFVILEAPAGFILNHAGRTPVVDQGDIVDITNMRAAYTDGADTCTAFLAIGQNGTLYLGHTDGYTFTETQKRVLENSAAVIAGSGDVSVEKVIKSQFPNIKSVNEIPKPIFSPQGKRPVFNLWVNPVAKEIVYDWGFVTDD
jgi:hypothetical protein